MYGLTETRDAACDMALVKIKLLKYRMRDQTGKLKNVWDGQERSTQSGEKCCCQPISNDEPQFKGN